MHLPLFPLNTVLFPEMPLKLHIFEERYKLMINECVENKTPFGVVLIEEGIEALGPLAQPHLIGTMAQITQVQRLPFGRMNILAVGRERFKIKSLDNQRAYLSGDVEPFPLMDDNPRRSVWNGNRLRPLVNQYLNALEKAGQVQFDESQIPDDPRSLAYLSAVILQTEAARKQEILSMETTTAMLSDLVHLYQREVVMLNVMLAPPEDNDNAGSFSVN